MISKINSLVKQKKSRKPIIDKKVLIWFLTKITFGDNLKYLGINGIISTKKLKIQKIVKKIFEILKNLKQKNEKKISIVETVKANKKLSNKIK